MIKLATCCKNLTWMAVVGALVVSPVPAFAGEAAEPAPAAEGVDGPPEVRCGQTPLLPLTPMPLISSDLATGTERSATSFLPRTCVCSCGSPCSTDADCGPGGICRPGFTCCAAPAPGDLQLLVPAAEGPPEADAATVS